MKKMRTELPSPCTRMTTELPSPSRNKCFFNHLLLLSFIWVWIVLMNTLISLTFSPVTAWRLSKTVTDLLNIWIHFIKITPVLWNKTGEIDSLTTKSLLRWQKEPLHLDAIWWSWRPDSSAENHVSGFLRSLRQVLVYLFRYQDVLWSGFVLSQRGLPLVSEPNWLFIRFR